MRGLVLISLPTTLLPSANIIKWALSSNKLPNIDLSIAFLRKMCKIKLDKTDVDKHLFVYT